jgi:hypothetical protein
MITMINDVYCLYPKTNLDFKSAYNCLYHNFKITIEEFKLEVGKKIRIYNKEKTDFYELYIIESYFNNNKNKWINILGSYENQ